MVVVVVIAALSVVGLRREADQSQLADGTSGATSIDAPVDGGNDQVAGEDGQGAITESSDPTAAAPSAPEPIAAAADSTESEQADPTLTAVTPTEAQLKALLQAWLDRKALVLRGDGSAAERLQSIARPGLVNQVRIQRTADQSAGVTQEVEASVNFMRVISRTPQRIELRADIDYRDETLNAGGAVVNSTAPGELKVTYILGRDNDRWRLQAYMPN